MNVWDSVRRLFGANTSAPSALRNRVGGMAWIRGCDSGDGDSVLNGRAVRTVSLHPSGHWVIEPPQEYIASADTFYMDRGFGVRKGAVLRVIGMHDDLLEPWKDAGDDAADESLAWLPPVPKPEILALPVREMGERYA